MTQRLFVITVIRFGNLFRLVRRREILGIEYYQHEDTNGDSGIGDVEYRLEKEEMVASYKRHPLRPIEAEQREVKHIDHLAMEQGRISAFRRKHRSHLGGIRIVEYQSVKHGIYNIAGRSCRNQRETHYIAALDVGFTLYTAYIDDQCRYSDNAEQGEKQFASHLIPNAIPLFSIK